MDVLIRCRRCKCRGKEVQRYFYTEVQWCRGKEMQRCKCRGKVVHTCRNTEMQRCSQRCSEEVRDNKNCFIVHLMGP